MLRALLETYLEQVGFHRSAYPAGGEYWGHPEMGEGRTFEQVVHWQMGREAAAGQGAITVPVR